MADKVIATGAVEGVLAQFRNAGGAEKVMIADAKVESVPSPEAAGAPRQHPEPAPTESSTPPTEVAGETPAGPERTDDPASSFSPRGVMADVSPNQRPGFDRIQLDPQDKFFANLAQAANAAPREQEDTIFRKVSRKIREMSDRQYLERVSVAGR